MVRSKNLMIAEQAGIVMGIIITLSSIFLWPSDFVFAVGLSTVMLGVGFSAFTSTFDILNNNRNRYFVVATIILAAIVVTTGYLAWQYTKSVSGVLGVIAAGCSLFWAVFAAVLFSQQCLRPEDHSTRSDHANN